MKLGCMTYSFNRALRGESITIPQVFSLIRELGGEGVDILAGNVNHYANSEIRQMVADAGLVVCCYVTGGPNFLGTDSAQRAKSLDDARRGIDNAQEIGAEFVLMGYPNCPEGMEKSEVRKLVANGISEVLPYAKQVGVILTVESRGSDRSPLRLGVEVFECCELAGPELMVTYDIGNMVLGDEDPVHSLKIIRERVVYAHAKDWALLPADAGTGHVSPSGKRYVGTVVGRGVIDYAAVFTALRQMKYEGFLSFEYEGSGDPVEAVREGMAYLRERIGS